MRKNHAIKKVLIIKNILLFVCLFIIVCGVPVTTQAQYVTLQAGGNAKVLEIIDGDAIKVQMATTGEIALVRLAGVDAVGFNGAVAYMNNELLGHMVELRRDYSVNDADGRWNHMFVYKQALFVNNALLERGYAKVPEGYAGSMRSTLVASEDRGKNSEIGLWTPEGMYTDYTKFYYAGDGVNINTCTASQLSERLNGVDSNAALNVVNYRNYSPFHTVSDIKFTGAFTRDMYANNRGLMTVSTDINTAMEKELLTLIDFTQSDVDRIINFRNTRPFTSLDQLHKENLISYSKYNANLPYIDITGTQQIYFAKPNRAANINTASREQLVSAGLNWRAADQIVGNRSWYTYKYIGELTFCISNNEINRMADNLTTVTDLNFAGFDEIRSLFGESAYINEADMLYSNRPYSSVADAQSYLSEEAYAAIEKYCTVNSTATGTNASYTNINAASMEQLRTAGISDGQASTLYNNRGRMTEPRYIPSDVSEHDDQITMYTNINKAGNTELESLFSSMGTDSSFAYDLISARDSQPFGTMEELRIFFEEHENYYLYNSMRNFMVLR